jgi:hypothetical protein
MDLRGLFDGIRTYRVIAEEEAAYRSDDSEGEGFDAAGSSINGH